MKFNFFNEAQPETVEELRSVTDGLNAKTAWVTINDGSIDTEPGDRFYGWAANISASNEEDETVDIQTCAWPSKEQLIADLNMLGFKDIQED